MVEPAPSSFQCNGCGKRYRWRPELAGRAVRCSCGAMIVIPQSAAEGEEPYGIAEPQPAQRPATTAGEDSAGMPRAEAPCRGRVLAYQGQGAFATADDYFPDRIKDLYMPLVMLAISIPVLFIAGWREGTGRGIGAAQAMTEVGAQLVFGTIVMLGAIFFAAKRRGFKIGRFWAAVLKLSAVSLAPSAVMTLLSLFLRFVPFGDIINWIVGFCLYFALIGAFFDLDEPDTWYCVAIMFIVNIGIWLGARWLLRA